MEEYSVAAQVRGQSWASNKSSVCAAGQVAGEPGARSRVTCGAAGSAAARRLPAAARAVERWSEERFCSDRTPRLGQP